MNKSRKNRQRKIFMVLSDKGGVGKSLVTRALAQYFLDKAFPILSIN